MGLQPVSLDSPNAMSVVDGATIERRIRISRPDEERGRCKGSRAWDPRKDFSQCMPQPTTLSTSSAISPQQERTEPSGNRPCRRGVKSSLPREPDVPGDLLRAIFSNVTEPVKGIGFRSLTEALDTTTAQGRLVFHIFGALAEFERSLIRERTQAGLAAARRIGRTGGRPPKLTDDDIGCEGDARQSRHRRHPNRASPRRLSRDALSVHPRRANSEYLRRLKAFALTQKPDASGVYGGCC